MNDWLWMESAGAWLEYHTPTAYESNEKLNQKATGHERTRGRYVKAGR